ncbi:MAG: peptidoglycan editing factor PgeF [Anaerolineales bacterium]|nr:peptidoglycan editing factor PgeF [Anaerolineales bacterium]
MPFRESGSTRFFNFDSLMLPGTKHAVFTRHGGVSPAPWDSLNFGSIVGDSQARVHQNLLRALSALEIAPSSVYDVRQIHSNLVVEAVSGRNNAPPQHADAILTRARGVTLLMRFADCVPILLLDPVIGVIGIAHAGWQGTVKNVVGAAVNQMKAHYGVDPANILAGIGPSICQDHYQVGQNVIDAVQARFGDDAEALLDVRESGCYFDLWSANRALLEQSGVCSIEVAGICTACSPEDWFSHRASGGTTGRFAALITFTE